MGQVKVRGVWVDLDHLQQAVSQITGSQAAVVCQDNATLLVAMECTAQPVPTPLQELNARLAESFPTEARITAAVCVPALPRLFNGKIDYQSLPTLFSAPQQAGLDDTEVLLVRCMQTVDEFAGTSLASNIRQQEATLQLMGFDSLKRAELLVELQRAAGIELQMADLEAPISRLVGQIQQLLAATRSSLLFPTTAVGRAQAQPTIPQPHRENREVAASQTVRPRIESADLVVIERCNRVKPRSHAHAHAADGDDDKQYAVTIEPVWHQSMQKCVDASACVLVNRAAQTAIAVVGSHAHIVAAFDVGTGAQLWRTELRKSGCESSVRLQLRNFSFDCDGLVGFLQRTAWKPPPPATRA